MLDMIRDPDVSAEDKAVLLDALEKKHPSRYRKFKWEEIFLHHFQQNVPGEKYTAV